MEYVVRDCDSVERIAAFHDCTVGELMKINKMTTRMVFPGQILQVPVSQSKDETIDNVYNTNTQATSSSVTNIIDDNNISTSNSQHHTLTDSDGIRMGPGSAVLIQQRSLPLPVRSSSKGTTVNMDNSNNKKSTSKCDLLIKNNIDNKQYLSMTNDDEDGVQKFLKIKVKEVTEMDGTVSGTLLITPNALMFDPDVTHPLVIENGQELYMVMAHMDDIASVAVYKDIEALTQEATNTTDIIYDPDHLRTPPPQTDIKDETCENVVSDKQSEMNVGADSVFLGNIEQNKNSGASTTALSESESVGLTQIVEESEHRLSVADKENISDKDVMDEDMGSAAKKTDNKGIISSSYSYEHPSTVAEQRRSLSETAAEAMKACESDQNDARAHSIKGSVTSGAGKVTQTAMSGTKSVAHGVVTHTKSAADTLQSGFETSAKMAASHARGAVDVMTSLPQGIVTVGSGLLEGLQTNTDDTSQQHSEVRNEASMRREQSLATLEALKQRTQLVRENLNRENLRSDSNVTTFACATSMSDMPELFKPVNEIISKPSATSTSNNYSHQYIISQLPYYMIVRLNKKKKHSKSLKGALSMGSSSSSNDNMNNTRLTRREFWFAIPRNKANAIYQFLLQWTPDKYGQEESKVTSSIAIPKEECHQSKEHDDAIELAYSLGHGNGFIVLDSDADEKLMGEKPPTPVFGKGSLNREWEIVTVEEMCRRLSLTCIDQMIMPIPDGANESQILDEDMIREIMQILPARAEGYPWVNIYNSEKHGFSLHTFYRKMMEWDEDMSPILLIIRDCQDHVFGGIASSAIRPSEHFFGTGDSSLLFKFVCNTHSDEKELRSFKWSGDNQYFVKANKDSLIMGAGRGHYGIWLDADLNYGRSQRCDTFKNEPLAGDFEDFNIQFIEAFGFKMV